MQLHATVINDTIIRMLAKLFCHFCIFAISSFFLSSFIYFRAHGTQFPRAAILNCGNYEYVWNGPAADLEIANVSARQA